MKRTVTTILFILISAFACIGQSVSKLIPVKELIEKESGDYCVRAEYAGLHDSSKLTFFLIEDDFIIPVQLQKNDLTAEKRFLALTLKEGDIVCVKGTIDDIVIEREKYKGLVEATIIVKEDSEDATDEIEDEEEESIPFQLVEKKPRFNGGDTNEFSIWVNSHLEYPMTAKENGIQGRVTVQFTVEADGSVSGVKVLRGVEASLDQEAVRVVSASPEWQPGLQRGKPVRVTYTFPVIFQMR